MSIQLMINVADVNPRQFKLSPQIYMDLLTGCKSKEEYLPPQETTPLQHESKIQICSKKKTYKGSKSSCEGCQKGTESK